MSADDVVFLTHASEAMSEFRKNYPDIDVRIIQTVDKVRGKPRAFLVEKTKKNTENTGFFSVFLV